MTSECEVAMEEWIRIGMSIRMMNAFDAFPHTGVKGTDGGNTV